MANGRNSMGRKDDGRDGTGFIAMPWVVMDCPAYISLSHPARSLLWEFARQFVRDNNGRLLASKAYLAKRGWTSADVIHRAKKELIAKSFIFETVKGQRPNKASWYALTWRNLDKLPGYDYGAASSFERSAYKKNQHLTTNAALYPPGRAKKANITPPHGVVTTTANLGNGTIKPIFDLAPIPVDGNHLENHLH